jgi:hypothetical protein
MLESRIRILEDYNGQHAAVLYLEKENGYLTSLNTQKDEEIMVLRNYQSQLNDLNGAQHQEILRLQEGLKALGEQAVQKESESLRELGVLGHIQNTQCEVILGLQGEIKSLREDATRKKQEIAELQSKSMGQLDQSLKDNKITLYRMWREATLPEDRAKCERCSKGAKVPLLPCFRRLCDECGPCACESCNFARS